MTLKPKAAVQSNLFYLPKYFLLLSRSIRRWRVLLLVMWNNSFLFGREGVAKIKWINTHFRRSWRQTGPAVWSKTAALKLSEVKDKGPDRMNGANCFACHHIDPEGFKWRREDWRCLSSVCVQQTSRLSLWLRLSEGPRYRRLNGIKHVGLHLFIEGLEVGEVGWAPLLEQHFDFVSLGAALPLVMLSLRM